MQRLTSSPEFGRPYAALPRADRRLVDGLVSTGRGADARALIRERSAARTDRERTRRREWYDANKDAQNERRRDNRAADNFVMKPQDERTGDNRPRDQSPQFWKRYRDIRGYN